jgi:hypothetical protein
MQKFKNILSQSFTLLLIFIVGFIVYYFIPYDSISEDLVLRHIPQCYDDDCYGLISSLSDDLNIFVIFSHFINFWIILFWIFLKEFINNNKLTQYILVTILSFANIILSYNFISLNNPMYSEIPMIVYSSFYLIYNSIFLFIFTTIFKRKIMKKFSIIIISSLVIIVFSWYILLPSGSWSMEHSVYVGSGFDDCAQEHVNSDDRRVCQERACKLWEEDKPKSLFLFNIFFKDAYACP